MENNSNLEAMRHSCEHLLHRAIEMHFKGAVRAMGPATDEGFYHDFDYSGKVSDEDFPALEKIIQEAIDAKLPITRKEISIEEARKLFKDNPYKLDWIDMIEKKKAVPTVYIIGDESNPWDIDLCKGPHVTNTSEIGPFKLLSVAGAYWHGDEKNKMLVRIYGTCFSIQAELDEFIMQKEDAKKNDHRKLGKELDLFTFSDLVGSGFPLYTPRGAWIRRQLNNFIEELQTAEGYEQVWTPQVARGELFKISGHYDKYKADMFKVVSNYSDEEMFLKPMNCPQHTQIYASRMRSYKDLPLRFTDFAMLYRDEKPGELHGLARVRSFSQDDCHVFCTPEQVDEEVDKALKMTKIVMKTLGFKYKYRLSTRDPQHPEKYLGDPKVWDKVEKWAVEIMKRNEIEYFDGPGEAAFYAPKMDLIATDSLGREWQLSTVQIDFVGPERFKLKYTDTDGKEKTPVMIHRAILGSAERMMMILLEHFRGALPLWLSPDQVAIIPISDQNLDYANKVKSELDSSGIRNYIDKDSERMQNKIRKAQGMKVPYMFIVGKKEEESQTLSVRMRNGEEKHDLKLNDFIARINKEIKEKQN